MSVDNSKGKFPEPEFSDGGFVPRTKKEKKLAKARLAKTQVEQQTENADSVALPRISQKTEGQSATPPELKKTTFKSLTDEETNKGPQNSAPQKTYLNAIRKSEPAPKPSPVILSSPGTTPSNESTPSNVAISTPGSPPAPPVSTTATPGTTPAPTPALANPPAAPPVPPTASTTSPGAPQAPPTASATPPGAPPTPPPAPTAPTASATPPAAPTAPTDETPSDVSEIVEFNKLSTDPNTRLRETGFIHDALEHAAGTSASSQSILAEYIKKGYRFNAQLETENRDGSGQYELELFTPPDEPERMCYRVKSFYTLIDDKGKDILHKGIPITFERIISTGASDPQQAVACAKEYMNLIMKLAQSNAESGIDPEFHGAALSQRVFYVDMSSENKNFHSIKFENSEGKSLVHRPTPNIKKVDIRGKKINYNVAFERQLSVEVHDIHEHGVHIKNCDLAQPASPLDSYERSIKEHSDTLNKRLAAKRKKYEDEKIKLNDPHIQRIIATHELKRDSNNADNCTDLGKQLFKARKELQEITKTMDSSPQPAKNDLQVFNERKRKVIDLENAIEKEFQNFTQSIALVQDLNDDLRAIQSICEGFKNNHNATATNKQTLQEIIDNCKQLGKEITRSVQGWEKLLMPLDVSGVSDVGPVTSPPSPPSAPPSSQTSSTLPPPPQSP